MSEETIGVVGLGLLGRGIAACYLGYGFRVVGVDRGEKEIAEAERVIEEAIGEMITRGVCGEGVREQWRERYAAGSDFGMLKACDLVIESVVEDAAVKGEVFDRVEAVVGTGTPIASNTSAIPISELQEGRARPERFLGMHWCAPAYSNRFLEIIRGARTGDAAVEKTVALGRAVAKDCCVLMRDVPGFIVNRLTYAVYREACHLLEEGVADAKTIDLAWRNGAGLFSTLLGPFRWIDLTGGPALYAQAMERVINDLSDVKEVPPTLQKLREEGAVGMRGGKGFYEYTEEEAAKWERLYEEHVWAVREMQERYSKED